MVRDLKSLNGVFVKIDAEEALESGDVIRVGQELLRFEIIAPPAPLEDGTEVAGTPNPGFWGRLSVIVGRDVDGSAFPLFGDAIVMGRERGDILFPEDGYVSGTHARITLRDGRVYLADVGSSNGTFLRVRGERKISREDSSSWDSSCSAPSTARTAGEARASPAWRAGRGCSRRPPAWKSYFFSSSNLVGAAALAVLEEGVARVLIFGGLDVAEAVLQLEHASVIERDGDIDGTLVTHRRDSLDLAGRGDGHHLGLLAAEPHFSLGLPRQEAVAEDGDFLTSGRRPLAAAALSIFTAPPPCWHAAMTANAPILRTSPSARLMAMGPDHTSAPAVGSRRAVETRRVLQGRTAICGPNSVHHPTQNDTHNIDALHKGG